MKKKENILLNTDDIVLHDTGGETDYWKLAAEKRIKESLALTHTERFRIMMRLMRIDNMLSRAKITHKQIP